jgi:RHS repeat-associated protein
VVAQTRYRPYGEERWTAGGAVSDYTFTGQRDERGFGLMDYGARYYDPYLGRFISADTVVPDYANPQALNRYAYTLGNPLRYTDPTGHYIFEEDPDDPYIMYDKSAELGTLVRASSPEAVGLGQESGQEWVFGRIDGVGWRFDVSGGEGLAGDVNLDLVWNWRSREVAPCFTGGIQGITKGGAASTGLLVIFNMADLGGYEGRSYHAGVTIAKGPGAEVDISSSAAHYKGEIPLVAYIAPAFGTELSLYGGAGETVTIPLPSPGELILDYGKSSMEWHRQLNAWNHGNPYVSQYNIWPHSNGN